MKKFFIFVVCLVFATTSIGAIAFADATMDRIEKTGKIRVGWREGSIPFAFIDPKVGKHVGFSVDMTYLLVDKLSEHFGKKIEIQPFTVTPKTRIPMVANATVDVEMGSTTYTQKREEVVDFSLTFFVSETTFLVPKDSDIKTLDDLNGKRLGAARGTTNLKAIEDQVAAGKYTPKDIVVVETHPEGFLALKSGKVDAYSTDRSLLEGLRMKAPHPENWKTVDFAIAYEPYGYMCREGNSDIRDFINNTIIWSIKTGKFFEMYDKWMGPNGVVPIPRSKAYEDYLQLICYPQSEDWWKKK
ncbi:MAG: transporter substrate-binding domain-containing protein [Deltaproteobacteria bacterium]|nr:transporter substrate-binding domain-containing protein [Deltaproteobacteria bacterium]MBW2076606.1 transporter substrate-binding domain-containing protein [Deltaproteobacteria bacterium]MBW2310246.1 transporter substrate-binding domain-containing protein [Deltaproteobacteria bacterium]